MRKPHVVVLVMAVVLALLSGGVARADEGMLPPAVNASRLEELLDRAGYRNLPVDTRRVIRDLHAEYDVAYATIRDSRTEAWLKDVDALFSLSKAPNEVEVRRLLQEHGALVDRAAAIDRDLFAKLAAILPSGDVFEPPADLAIAEGLRGVDRMAASMPFQSPVGVRGDLHEMVEHLDVAAERMADVTAVIMERDRALPGRVREVWVSSRQLLVAAAKGFDDVLGGVLPKLGAALDEEEAKRLRAEIVAKCNEDIERCLKARRRVREADDRAVAAVLLLLEPPERRELLIRVAFPGAPSRVRAANTEAAFRAAKRLFEEGDVRAAIDAAEDRWGAALAEATRARLQARDLENDRELSNGTRFGGFVIDFASIADLPGDRMLEAATESARELGAILAPHEVRLEGSGLRLVLDSDDARDRRPSATSVAWQRSFAAAIQSVSDTQRPAKDPRISLSESAGVAPWWDDRFVEEAVLAPLAQADRDAARAIMADAAEEHARRVRTPVTRAKELLFTEGDLEARRRAALDAIRMRNEAFFACEAIDAECFSSLQALARTDAARQALERAAFERAYDRELLSIDLYRCALANPFTAFRIAELSPKARARVARALVDSMRTVMPDVRRSRAAAFAKAEYLDALVYDGVMLPKDAFGPRFEETVRATYDADRLLEKSIARLVASLAEAADGESGQLARAYAVLAMRQDDDLGSPAVARTLARVGRLGLDEARTAEIASLARTHSTIRSDIVLERALVDSGWRDVRNRSDEITRLTQLIEHCDDGLVAGVLAILTPEERATVVGGDSLDRILGGTPDTDEPPAS